jgi:tRNA-dihydrouridine synthase A
MNLGVTNNFISFCVKYQRPFSYNKSKRNISKQIYYSHSKKKNMTHLLVPSFENIRVSDNNAVNPIIKPWDIREDSPPSSRALSDGFELSIAPMMKQTDFHFHYLMRHFTKHTRLYTEMIVDDTILHQLSNLKKFIGYNKSTHPITIQLGGNEPEKLAKAAKICEEWGYDEINLNVGCPSPKVSQKCFGARLMLHPEIVKECCEAMKKVVQVPVTVKCRLGADDVDSYEDLVNFVNIVNEAGVKHYIIHARKCLLDGLSTRENRTIPKLNYERVYRIANEFKDNDFSINGGIKTLEDSLKFRERKIQQHNVNIDNTCDNETHEVGERNHLRGAMIGRGAWSTPFMFANADNLIYGEKNPGISRREALYSYIEYAEHQMSMDENKTSRQKLNNLMKPCMNLFKGELGGNLFRRRIDEGANVKKLVNVREILLNAMEEVDQEALDRTY